MKFLLWTPRILSILFTIFLATFALDAFNEGVGWGMILGFLIHLLPSLMLLLATGLAWRYDLVGAAFFLGFAVLYVWEAGLDRPWSWYAFIAGPSALVGLLYAANWWYTRKRMPAGR